MPRPVKKTVSLAAAFWDASGLVPLCCQQIQTRAARQARRLFPQMIVWWATKIECISALRRLERAQALTAQEAQQALQELDRLCIRWTEVVPLDEVREGAEFLLGRHDLHAADSMQLAAALVWCNSHPKGRTFIGGDDRLLDAAKREGFKILRI